VLSAVDSGVVGEVAEFEGLAEVFFEELIEVFLTHDDVDVHIARSQGAVVFAHEREEWNGRIKRCVVGLRALFMANLINFGSGFVRFAI